MYMAGKCKADAIDAFAEATLDRKTVSPSDGSPASDGCCLSAPVLGRKCWSNFFNGEGVTVEFMTERNEPADQAPDRFDT